MDNTNNELNNIQNMYNKLTYFDSYSNSVILFITEPLNEPELTFISPLTFKLPVKVVEPDTVNEPVTTTLFLNVEEPDTSKLGTYTVSAAVAAKL